MGYVFPGIQPFVTRAAERLGVPVNVRDIERMPQFRNASCLLAQLGTSPDPAGLVEGARKALLPCQVAVLAAELALEELVEQQIIPAAAVSPARESVDPDTGLTPAAQAASQAAAAAAAQIAAFPVPRQRSKEQRPS